MQVSAAVTIDAPVAAVWRIVSDIENATDTISAIEKIEVLERPADGLVGLKWVETRTMFGKTATETMWITSSAENDYYETEASSHGAHYRSRLSLGSEDGRTTLRMDFRGEPLTFGARLMYLLLGWMFKGGTQKALQKDLDDIKAAAESGAS